MFNPRCVRNGSVCPLHREGKFTKWMCGVYRPQERAREFQRKKIPCSSCGKKITPTAHFCQKCRGKLFSSPLLGKKLPKWWCQRISDGQKKGEESPNWAKNPSYWTIHTWLVKNYGNPPKCENCGKLGKRDKRGCCSIQWASIKWHKVN